MAKNFIVRPIEEYRCEHCGQLVAGGRYNNHCPSCLWSKHLDRDLPGDRKSNCLGMMEPIGAVQKGNRWRIIHRCLNCDQQTIVDNSPQDNFEKIILLSTNPQEVPQTKKQSTKS
ncbi:MAG: RNHCP domain-containing protein [Patescibacteria group bacterium]